MHHTLLVCSGTCKSGTRQLAVRQLAAMQTDRKANSPLRQLTAKARGLKKHFAPYAS